MQNAGVDIIPIDKKVNKNCHTKVLKGTPSILKLQEYKHRTLLLCYPDDSNSMALKCLNNCKSDYIIHIGELLITQGGVCGSPQSCFGKTTAPDSQLLLFENYHCILIKKNYCFPFSNDYLTIWKKTIYINGFSNQLQNFEDNNDNNDDNNNDTNNDLDLWKNIPKDEQLNFNSCAPCLNYLKHLL